MGPWSLKMLPGTGRFFGPQKTVVGLDGWDPWSLLVLTHLKGKGAKMRGRQVRRKDVGRNGLRKRHGDKRHLRIFTYSHFSAISTVPFTAI